MVRSGALHASSGRVGCAGAIEATAAAPRTAIGPASTQDAGPIEVGSDHISNDAAPRWSAALYSALDCETDWLVCASRSFMSWIAPSHFAFAAM